MAYVNFGQFADLVMQHATELMMTSPAFKPVVESIALPGMSQQNLLMFKGPVKL